MLAEHSPKIQRAITTTTRPPRGEEKHGIDYYFLDEQEFLQNIDQGKFIEYAKVHNRYYGTFEDEIFSKLQKGHDVLLNVDVQGAATFRKKAKNNPALAKSLVSIFVMPPSIEELKKRIVGRGTDSQQEIERRMAVAVEEIKDAPFYDHTILSGTRDEDFTELEKIYWVEKSR